MHRSPIVSQKCVWVESGQQGCLLDHFGYQVEARFSGRCDGLEPLALILFRYLVRAQSLDHIQGIGHGLNPFEIGRASCRARVKLRPCDVWSEETRDKWR